MGLRTVTVSHQVARWWWGGATAGRGRPRPDAPSRRLLGPTADFLEDPSHVWYSISRCRRSLGGGVLGH